MTEKEYIVSLKKGVNYQKFYQEMITAFGNDIIPQRPIVVANERPASERNTHYMLTDQEAQQLANDPRVLAVELRPDLRDDIKLIRDAVQTGNFSKTTLDEGEFINWGLIRSNAEIDPFEGFVTDSNYDYTLDGTGVDFIIHDSGLQVDHPEFQDSQGVSRVQQIDWYTSSGLAGSMPAGHYTDYDGHGTHCAGIAAGKTYGWAKNARIYAIKVSGLEGATDPNSGIPIADCFDIIKEWHRNKPIDPATGHKRPTVVNMSWGYGTYFALITGGNYRGTSWTGTNLRTDYGMVGRFDGIGYRYPTRVASVDVDLEELIEAGVHVCISAGNTQQKIDVQGGVDYDNYWISSLFGNRYYHRGGSPFSENAFIVGNIDSVLNGSNFEQKATSSETGPGVNMWAPGTNIMSSTSTVNAYTSGDYPPNTNYKITNISGTSMAAPQVAGVLALYLQINPQSTPAEAKTYLINQAKDDILFSTGSSNDYTENRSLQGSSNKFLFNKFNSAIQMRFGR